MAEALEIMIYFFSTEDLEFGSLGRDASILCY